MSENVLLSKPSKLCLDNAKQYIQDAQLLYSSKSYGHALALTVLSDIELGKSVIYHLCAKGLITEEVLPDQFISYYKEKKYEILAQQTWWVGLVLASNVDALIPSIFTLVQYSEKISTSKNKSELSQETKDIMLDLINELKPKIKNIYVLLNFACESFFVNFKIKEKYSSSPLDVKKSLVKERIEKVKERIENGEPFLLLSFSEVQRKIGQGLLRAAFESIIPIRTEINQFIIPLTNC
jgi:AbiV family abortive infection protein